ncbi:MAG: hypothetical protein ABS85_04495 [Sphingobacteriales bacterium SCN 48-20]|uniref:RHS repeat-associated core domain-containing protein n=1 Tax=Terrimonas ferruginea TaxID=249 RepID=UPI0008692EAB|nr:RHS repeat-associated core domain-containing protein [Terrimonas ferruginea]MBN8781584.1 hypothetical protein [Terrimonas ferruginea]ODT94044.1 MAG: hypothetical protein ABS85_04495 [Sphingobacteriales bacterium SCN 48-20]OJW44746.1 MAG: hypothetical protein BGO56_14900 [Sphingobacteriales bacterium 48-107]
MPHIFFDEQFKMVSGGASPVNPTGFTKDHFSDLQNLAATKNGYLYVYVSNESPVNVFFDNLQLLHMRSAVLEETHYYPFGLTMAGISYKSAGELKNRFKYNGIAYNDDLGINIYEALYRNLDPQIGRFHQVDLVTTYYETPFASMQNNPITKRDWLGNYFTWANGGEEAYKKLRAENGRRLKGYITELSALDLHDENNLNQISQLTKLIDRHTELNAQWNEMEESDVEFNVSLENSGPGTGEGTAGYNIEKRRIDIKLYGRNGNSFNVLAHELRHGYGYLAGEFVGGKSEQLYDLTDEVVANDVGYLFLDRTNANRVVDGFFTVEKFAENSTTVNGSTYSLIKDRKVSLALNTPAAILLQYTKDSYIKSFINRNSANANLTIQDALNAANELDRKAGRTPTYIFGNDLKNR